MYVCLFPDIWTQELAVVQLYQGEGEYFDKANDSEDSDYESSPERHSEPAPEEKYSEKIASGSKTLPVITTGSFSTYVQSPVAVGRELLTFPAAGGRCSSICAPMSYSLRPSNPKAPMRVHERYGKTRHWTDRLHAHPKQCTRSQPQ